MFEINIFDKIGMSIDWEMVYYGIKNHFLNTSVAQDFACRYLEYNEHLSEEELELTWNVNDTSEIITLIEKIPTIQLAEDILALAKDKLRIAIIIHLRETTNNVENLLEQIDRVYDDFGYPEDMEKFISYMPVDDPLILRGRTIEDNRKQLLLRLDTFIEEQKNKYHLS